MKPLKRSNLSRSNTSATSKTVSFLQYPIKIAVARDFVKREWITAAEMQELIANEEQNPQKAHKNQEDDNMEEIASSFQAP
jgi:hypothetical protein